MTSYWLALSLCAIRYGTQANGLCVSLSLSDSPNVSLLESFSLRHCLLLKGRSERTASNAARMNSQREMRNEFQFTHGVMWPPLSDIAANHSDGIKNYLCKYTSIYTAKQRQAMRKITALIFLRFDGLRFFHGAKIYTAHWIMHVKAPNLMKTNTKSTE